MQTNFLAIFLGLLTTACISTFLTRHQMKSEFLKQTEGLTREDHEVLQSVLRSIERIEERLEALETLAMDREREEKFGMKL